MSQPKLVKVNADRTLSFLAPGRPPNNVEKFYIEGKPLEALLDGKTVTYTKSGNLRIRSNSNSSSIEA